MHVGYMRALGPRDTFPEDSPLCCKTPFSTRTSEARLGDLTRGTRYYKCNLAIVFGDSAFGSLTCEYRQPSQTAGLQSALLQCLRSTNMAFRDDGMFETLCSTA